MPIVITHTAALSILSLLYFAQPLFALPADDIRWEHGPATLDIDGVATITIPAGYIMAKGDNVRLLLQRRHAPFHEADRAIVARESFARTYGGYMLIRYNKIGYVKEDGGEIDKDKLLRDKIRRQELANRRRKSLGYRTGVITGWAIEPYYNEKKGVVEYGLNIAWYDPDGRLKNNSTNFHSALLGREGVLTIQIVEHSDTFDKYLRQYAEIIESIAFYPALSYASVETKPLKEEEVSQYSIVDIIQGDAVEKEAPARKKAPQAVETPPQSTAAADTTVAATAVTAPATDTAHTAAVGLPHASQRLTARGMALAILLAVIAAGVWMLRTRKKERS